MKKSLRYSFLIFLLLLSLASAHGQTGTDFWFVVPEVSADRGDRPAFLVFSTYELPADILVSMPSPGKPLAWTDTLIRIPANSSYSWQISHRLSMLENSYTGARGHNGIYMTSQSPAVANHGEFSVYYQIAFSLAKVNPEIFVLKGTNAVGNDFVLPFQNEWDNRTTAGWTAEPYSAADIVVTTPNTRVYLDIPAGKAIHPGIVGPQTNYLLGVFQPGETWSLIPNGFNRTAAAHLGGVRVHSPDGQFAVTIKDDNIHPPTGELIGCQLVPVNRIGTKYALAKSAANNERVYITTTAPNTMVTVGSVTINIPAARTVQAFTITDAYTFIRADKPVYAMQVSGFGNRLASDILPPIDNCTGATRVSFARPNGNDAYLVVLVRNGAEGGFLINGAVRSDIFRTDQFEIIDTLPGEPRVWKIDTIRISAFSGFGSNSHITISNTMDVFHLGFIGGSGANPTSFGARMGYFSNYNNLDLYSYIGGTRKADTTLCYGESIQLVADGGTDYQWTSDTALWLDDAYSPVPKARPLSTVTYTVNATGACNRSFTRDFTVHVSAPFEAAFNKDTTIGCNQLDVEFTDVSKGAKTYYWDFGDGTNQPGSNVNADTIQVNRTFGHTFTNPFGYPTDTTIRLIINRNTRCTDTLEQTITVYPQPVASFSTSDTAGCHPWPVSFTHTSTFATSYQWDFGGAGSSNTPNAAFTFENFHPTLRDTFMVQFIANFAGKCSDTATQEIVVYPRLEAGFTIDKASGCTPLNVQVQNASLGSPTSSRWDFFGSISPGPLPNTFSRSFVNTTDTVQQQFIELWISNGSCTDSVTRLINVFPAASALFDTSYLSNCQPVEVNFTHNPAANTAPVSLHWDFNDGTSASSTNPNHIFTNLTASDITRMITLRATTDSGCVDTDTAYLPVYALVDAQFKVADTSGCAPFAIGLINQSGGDTTSYQWNYGDGSPNTALRTHTYQNTSNAYANHVLELVVRNSRGCRDTARQNIQVFPQIFAGFRTSDDNYAGCQPFLVNFNDTTNPAATILSWKMGDGTSSAFEAPSHTFVNPGTIDSVYRVDLLAESPDGCKDTAYRFVRVYPFVEANFTLTRADSCSDSKGRFRARISNHSPGGVSQYQWRYGDGSISAVNAPFHTHLYPLNQTGASITDTLWQRVNNHAGCADSMFRLIHLRPEVVAGFVPDTAGCNALPVNFRNTSNVAATRFYWTFGDSLNAFGRDTSIVFRNLAAVNKVYPITLYASADWAGYSCTDTAYRTVTVYPFVKADFSVSDNEVCYNTPITITNNSSPGTTTFGWDLQNDGIYDRTDAGTYQYNWNTGTQDGDTITMKLRSTDANSCADSITKQIVIYPQVRPVIAFSDSAGCHPFTVLFDNRTENVNPADIFEWSFGAGYGTSSAFEPVPQVFINEGKTDLTYTLTLYAEDRDHGCYGHDTLQIVVNANPKAGFTIDGNVSISCPPFDLIIRNTSDTVRDHQNTYHWIFGDSNDAFLPYSPVTYEYNNTGSTNEDYLLRQIVTTDAGCIDSFWRIITVFPEVSAAFTTLPDTASCSPFVVDFDASASVNETSYDWDFNNDEYSNDVLPRINFVNNDTAVHIFDVRMIARSDNQCSDTAWQAIVVYPQPEAIFHLDKHKYYYPDSFAIFNDTPDRAYWNNSWTFDDGTSLATDADSLFKFYAYWGVYNIWLHVSGPQCADSMMRTVEVMAPLPIAAFDSATGGCTPFAFPVWDSSRYAHTLQWYLDDALVHTEMVPNPTDQVNPSGRTFSLEIIQPGTYNLSMLATGDGGTSTHNHLIEVYKTPEVDFTFAPEPPLQLPDNSILQTNNISEESEGNTFIWVINNTNPLLPLRDSIREKDIVYNFPVPGFWEISLFNTSVYGCVDSVKKSVEVIVRKLFSVPNAFMPNLNGPNGGWYDVTNTDNPELDPGDVFHPVTEGVVTYDFRIYNRWGQLIFESYEINIGWDGYVNGKLAQQDVYVWRASLKFQDGSVRTYAGDVTLIHGKGKQP